MAGDRDRAEVLGPVHERAEPDRDGVCLSDPGGDRPPRALGPLVALERAEQLLADVRVNREDPALGRLDRLLQLPDDSAHLIALERAVCERKRPSRHGVAPVHRLPHRERDHSVAVEAGGKRVADAADRLGELLALALHLLDLGLELNGHVVELAAQRGELVVPVERHGPSEVTARQAPRRLEEGRDLPGESSAHVARAGEREEHEEQKEDRDHQAVARYLLRERGRGGEDPELHRGTGRAVDPDELAAVLLALHLEVADIAGRREAEAPPLKGGGQRRPPRDTEASSPVSAATRVTSADARVTDTVRIIDEPSRVSELGPGCHHGRAGPRARDALTAPRPQLHGNDLPMSQVAQPSRGGLRPPRATAGGARDRARLDRGPLRAGRLLAMDPMAVRTPAAMPASALPVSLRAVSAKARFRARSSARSRSARRTAEAVP